MPVKDAGYQGQRCGGRSELAEKYPPPHLVGRQRRRGASACCRRPSCSPGSPASCWSMAFGQRLPFAAQGSPAPVLSRGGSCHRRQRSQSFPVRGFGRGRLLFLVACPGRARLSPPEARQQRAPMATHAPSNAKRGGAGANAAASCAGPNCCKGLKGVLRFRSCLVGHTTPPRPCSRPDGGEMLGNIWTHTFYP
jgi:hypothetical protein